MSARATHLNLAQRLRDPHVWDPTLSEVGFLQTHISWLFFTPDRVFKVKRPVDFGFLDFTTLEQRRRSCDEEVRLNARLAPGVHLGVAPLVSAPDGHLHVGPIGGSLRDFDGELVEWAVVMRRLPEHDMFDGRLARGEIDNDCMDILARTLVDFHADASTGTGIDEYGHPAVIARHCEQNFETLADFSGPVTATGKSVVSPTLLAFLSERTQEFLRDHDASMRRRMTRGRIREGHGDLHAGNICWVDRKPVIYDRIEFAAEYRCGDVAADLAFLAMDLDLRGFRGFSRYLVKHYVQLAHDPELVTLIGFYKSYRAVVRAKVDALRSADTTLDAAERLQARLTAMRHLHLAATEFLPPPLVLTCGLPGVGKSVVARQLAAPFESQVIRSDVVRKQDRGLPPSTRDAAAWNEGPYSPEARAHTYQSLLNEAITALEHGRAVVVDAAFPAKAMRRRFVDAAQRLEHGCVVAHVECPQATVRERLVARAQAGTDPSDADWDTYVHAREDFEAPREVHPELLITVHSGEPAEFACGRLIDRLVVQRRMRPTRSHGVRH